MSKKRYKHTTARQVGGDDGYCWAVFVNGKMKVNGLTRPEVAYYRDRFEKEEEEKTTARLQAKQDQLHAAVRDQLTQKE